MKTYHKYLIIALAVIGLLISGYVVDIASNWTTQQIMNWIWNSSDSTISVRLKTSSGSVITNLNGPDSAAYNLSDTLTTAGRIDTVIWKSKYSFRYKFSVVCLLDTVNLIKVHFNGTKDSVYISANQTVTSDYFSPIRIDSLFIKRKNNNSQFQLVSQGL